MNIIRNILTKNDCFKTGYEIKVKGLMLHSVGCSQPSASVFINNWNKSGVEKCVHGFIETDGDVYITLPCMDEVGIARKGWHGGGASNSTHLGFEMTEPSTIKYIGGASWTDNNPSETYNHIIGTYNTAVDLFAQLCKFHNLNPLTDGVIISHNEGYRRGIASGHSDVEHIWNKFGLTMDGFRQAVNNKIIESEDILNIMTKDELSALIDAKINAAISGVNSNINAAINRVNDAVNAAINGVYTNVNTTVKGVTDNVNNTINNPAAEPSDWAKDFWERAKAEGITDGSTPQRMPTRQEVVTMILGATRKTGEASDWAKDIWAKVTQLGITDGTNPQRMPTRQEVVAMILKAMK